MMRLARCAAAALCFWLLTAAGCASMPDTAFLSQRQNAQAARFENARGPLSTRRSAAIVEALKRSSGDLDILERQIVLEQQITGNALITGNRVLLLQDGAATYKALFAAIAAAKNHVNVESYIIDDDDVGHRFADLLIERQAAGVQVNLIYDSFGSIGMPRAYFDRLRAAGVRVLEFNPFNPLALKRPWAPNHRDHRKLTIVDGRIAFLGGINISSVNSSGSSLKRDDEAAQLASGWRDTDIEVRGPVVAEFQKLFLDTWARQGAAALPALDYFPALAAEGDELVRAIGSSPEDPYSQIYLTLIAAIGNAEKQVYLTNAYFVPDPQLIAALTAAAARGVDVRLILPSHSDASPAFHAGRSHYAGLLAAGVKIHERRGALLHVKTAVIDSVWSCVGSSNLDWRSALDNDEVNAVILGRAFAARMLAAFSVDMAASQAIDAATWARRPLMTRVKEWLARLVERAL